MRARALTALCKRLLQPTVGLGILRAEGPFTATVGENGLWVRDVGEVQHAAVMRARMRPGLVNKTLSPLRLPRDDWPTPLIQPQLCVLQHNASPWGRPESSLHQLTPHASYNHDDWTNRRTELEIWLAEG